MFKHNLLIAWRNFGRSKTTFFINLVGLSSGLTFALLIYLWINHELSVDKFHANDPQLYEVMKNDSIANGIMTSGYTPGPLSQALAEEVPEVEKSVSVIHDWFQKEDGIVSIGNNKLRVSEQYVGKDFFEIFSYKLLEGDKKQVLTSKKSFLISDELALKLFHSTQNIVGKSVQWEQEAMSGSFLISGVFKKVPTTSTEQFDVLLSYDLFLENNEGLKDWRNSDPSTFLLIKKGSNIAALNTKIKDFLQSKVQNTSSTLFLRPYSDRYLYNTYENGVLIGGRIAYTQLFSIIAFFILLIACVNFMNLSTAKASQRLKEVGIKKVIGVRRYTLIIQYLGESIFMTLLSFSLAIILVELVLPQFNLLTGKQISLTWNLQLIVSALVIICFTGILAGSYPALYLSGFKPATVLKGKLNRSVGEAWTRKGLVVFQFTLSVGAIVAVLVIYQQISFIYNKNLGYDKAHVISFKRPAKLDDNLGTFLSEVRNIPGVVQASSSEHNVTGSFGGTTDISWEGKGTEEAIVFGNLKVDFGLIETLGFEMLGGRTFSRDYGMDSTKIIFNETAIKMMGIEDPIGKTVTVWNQPRQIIGVVKDFHFESFYEKVKPCFLQCEPNLSNIFIKLRAGAQQEAIAQIQKVYQKFTAGLALEFQFLDKDYQNIYMAENQVATLSKYFAGMAILISCLGLFGLAIFTTERRLKEIGIRKILGSSEWGIILLLSRDFTRMVGIAILIALPASYLLMKNWLDHFAYRIHLSLAYFIGAALLVLMITWLTVGIQTIRAARVNPVKCLRDE